MTSRSSAFLRAAFGRYSTPLARKGWRAGCRQEGQQRASSLAGLGAHEHGRGIGQHDLDLVGNGAVIRDALVAPSMDFRRRAEPDRARCRAFDEMAVE